MMPDEWHVGDPADWGDSVGVPDIPYMGYLYNEDEEDWDYPEIQALVKARQLSKEAWKLRNQDNARDALLKIDNAIDIYRKEAGFYNIRAIILEDMGNYDEALKNYDTALDMRHIQLFKDNKARLLGRIASRDSYSKVHWAHGLDSINEALKITMNRDDRKTFLRTKADILEKLGRIADARVCIALACEDYELIEEMERQRKIMNDSGTVFICIAGTQFYDEKAVVGDIVDLVEEPDNEHDPDAIRIERNGKPVGYVANSRYTMVEGVKSASEVKNMMKQHQKAEVMFLYLNEFLIARLL